MNNSKTNPQNEEKAQQEKAQQARDKELKLPEWYETIGFLFIIVGILTLLALGWMLLYGADTPQQFAIVALGSCLSWFLAHALYQTIRVVTRQANPAERDAAHWTATPRTISLAMAIFTAILFSVLVLLSFDLVLPFLVIAPFILFFPFSYMAYSAFQRPLRIKRLRSDFELLTAQWDEELYQHSFFNYSLHISLVMLVTLLGIFVIFLPLLFMPMVEIGDVRLTSIGLTAQVLRAMSFGFLGSLLFSFYYVYRRYTTSDLLPSVYLYCAITMILGMVFNYIAFRALDGLGGTTDDNATSGNVVTGLVDILSFAVGFFPILAVQWLTTTVYRAFGQRQRRSDQFPMDQIDGISQSQEIRLRDYGIDDAQNLASVEMPLLLINTPFPVQTVVDWVDQAVLMVLLNNVNMLDSFRKAHVRTMTDFRDLWGPYVDRKRNLERDRNATTVNSEIEAIDKKKALLKDDQTDIANALNSNINLLDALYISTNFDMNIHYLNNYRKNVELLLPGWASARYNRYLLEAHTLRLADRNDRLTEPRELTRLWNFVNACLQANAEVQTKYERDHDTGALGLIVEPTSVEAHLGLARLYVFRMNEVREQKQKDEYHNAAEVEYQNALQRILLAISEIGRLSKKIPMIEDWTAFHKIAADLLQTLMEEANRPPDPPGGGGGGASGANQVVPTVQPTPMPDPQPAPMDGNGSHPETPNSGDQGSSPGNPGEK
jgi:hypothetical protein